jgi:hypothetical protein
VAALAGLIDSFEPTYLITLAAAGIIVIAIQQYHRGQAEALDHVRTQLLRAGMYKGPGGGGGMRTGS